MILSDRLRFTRVFDTDDGGGGGGSPPPEQSAAAPVVAPDGTVQAPIATTVVQPPAAPELTDDAVAKYLADRGHTAIPASEAQRIQSERQAAEQRAQSERQTQSKAETEELAQLMFSDPAEYTRRMEERGAQRANEQAQTITQQARELATLPGQIMDQVRRQVPNLPEAEVAKIAKTLTDPSVTPAQLKMALAGGQVVAHAKSRAFDLMQEGKIPVRAGARSPNSVESVPDKPTSPAAADRDDAAAKMAKALGVSVDDIKKSDYFAGSGSKK